MRKNEIKETNKDKEGFVYYDTLDAYFPEEKLGEPIMYFPSNKENVIVTDAKINPFVNVITDSFNIHNAFRTNIDYKSTVFHNILDSCTEYMANSIMMNAIALLEDPFNSTGLINAIKPAINDEPIYGQNFYKRYDDFMYGCRLQILHNIKQNLNHYFRNVKDGCTSFDDVVDNYVPFMASVIECITKTYVFEGQIFISSIITNGGIDSRKLNEAVIRSVDKSVDNMKVFNMSGDAAFTLTYFNNGLDVFAKKIAELSEAIIYSGLFYFKQFVTSVDWSKLKDHNYTNEMYE